MTYLLAYWMAAAILIAMIRLPPVLSVNDGSRWDTVWSLTHGNGYIIDDAPYPTVDKVKRDGHFYSSKPPLMPTIVAAIAHFVNVIFGFDIPGDAGIIIRSLLFLVNVLPSVGMVILYGRLLEEGGYSVATCLYCLLVITFGTYLTAYDVTFNNHTVAACGTFATLLYVIRICYQGRTHWGYFAAAGLSAAWVVANELPAAPFSLIVFLWLLKIHPSRTVKYFVPSAAVVLMAYFYTTWLATGGLIPNYVNFNSPLYMYEGSYWRQPRGIDTAHDTRLFYAFNLLLGHHGIFSLTPVFIIALIGQIENGAQKTIRRLGLLLTCLLLGFYLIKSNNYGGVCHGPRWFFWLIPFWLLALPGAFERRAQFISFQIIAYVYLAVSVVSVALAITDRHGPWGASWLQLLMRKGGWIDY